MAMRTIVLKIHKPGRRKQTIIDEAMLSYTLAYQYLLDKARDEIEETHENYLGPNGSYNAKKLEKWVIGDLSKELNKFGIECFKDSLKMDFAMTMASYLQLKEKRTEVSYPVAYLTEKKWNTLYETMTEMLINGKMKAKQYIKEIEKLSSKALALKPIFFCRCAKGRDFCILYDEQKHRYFAKLYLMNVKSDRRSYIGPNHERILKHIQGDMEVLEASNRKERYIVVPLSFGLWQEQYLTKALDNPDIIKAARLVKKGNEYYLSVNIKIEEAKKVKTECFMGVARGIKHQINYTVVDTEGETITRGYLGSNGGSSRKSSTMNVDNMHKLVNCIVDIAVEYKAQVITQPLINIGDKLKYVDEFGNVSAPILSCNSYNKLNDILKYKLKGRGLPPPIETSPAGAFQTCPVCGLNASQNRFSKDMLICTACGTAMEIELSGSLNLAKKLIKYNNTAIEVKVEKTPQGLRFINNDLGLDYETKDPMNFLDEFKQEVRGLVKEFYANINDRIKEIGFKKTYSIIKRIESSDDFTKLLKVIE